MSATAPRIAEGFPLLSSTVETLTKASKREPFLRQKTNSNPPVGPFPDSACSSAASIRGRSSVGQYGSSGGLAVFSSSSLKPVMEQKAGFALSVLAIMSRTTMPTPIDCSMASRKRSSRLVAASASRSAVMSRSVQVRLLRSLVLGSASTSARLCRVRNDPSGSAARNSCWKSRPCSLAS